ncbi:hypothetical protein OH77DRAFT_101244 [Trametes cingulata]|nr:hypothetical protein OH77DRAFT_101244 [Trametes cingulata]
MLSLMLLFARTWIGGFLSPLQTMSIHGHIISALPWDRDFRQLGQRLLPTGTLPRHQRPSRTQPCPSPHQPTNHDSLPNCQLSTGERGCTLPLSRLLTTGLAARHRSRARCAYGTRAIPGDCVGARGCHARARPPPHPRLCPTLPVRIALSRTSGQLGHAYGSEY